MYTTLRVQDVAGACALQQCNEGAEHVLCCGDDLCVSVCNYRSMCTTACARCGVCVRIAAAR